MQARKSAACRDLMLGTKELKERRLQKLDILREADGGNDVRI